MFKSAKLRSYSVLKIRSLGIHEFVPIPASKENQLQNLLHLYPGQAHKHGQTVHERLCPPCREEKRILQLVCGLIRYRELSRTRDHHAGNSSHPGNTIVLQQIKRSKYLDVDRNVPMFCLYDMLLQVHLQVSFYLKVLKK